jgi:hypothetical protein
LQLDTANTWVIKGRTSDALLEHEQGHWDIFWMMAKEMERELQGLSNKEADSRFQAINEKYKNFNKQYEDETQHSRIASKQKEWNCKIASAMRNGNLDLSVVCDL